MKSGELKKVVQAYATRLPTPWRRVGNEFIRHEGDWVQIVAFNASRFSEQYVPRSCMEFLKMPGVPTGSLLVQELQNPNATQRWVKLSEDPADVFQQMAKQFSPSPLGHLDLAKIKLLLTATTTYWPHVYALCVMACEEGNPVEAGRWFNAFMSVTADKPYPWVETRKQELADCLKLIASPDALKMRLDTVRAEKLRALKLEPHTPTNAPSVP
jgi:hypothetical protein